MFDFITFYALYLTAHLFGIAIGAGAAFMSDVLFLSSIKNKILSTTEVRIIGLMSTMVWIGLGLLVLSGVLLFSLDPAGYLGSAKFLAKMTVVGVLVMNGVVFNLKHIPFIKSMENVSLSGDEAFKKQGPLLALSGAISAVSWSFAIILGIFRSIPYSYLQMISVYLFVVFIAILVALRLERKYFHQGYAARSF